MGNIVTMASRGMTRHYANEVNAGRGVMLAMLLRDGQEADATLEDRLTMAEVLAVPANVEAAWQGGTPYVRKSYSAVTVLAQPTGSRVDFDLSDPRWITAGNSTTPYKLGKAGVAFAPTPNAVNGLIVPLVWMDYPYWADGSDLEVTLDAAGWYRN